MGSKPSADISINTELIETLLSEFVPELSDAPIEFHSAGWDNEIHRVGEHHAVRLPRRQEAAILAENEQRWLPELADLVPLPIPNPTFAGKPAFGYPWHWSVVPWIGGVPLVHAPPVDKDVLMSQLADFLNPLHTAAPEDAPRNPYRGVPLVERVDSVSERIDGMGDVLGSLDITVDHVQTMWRDLVSGPEFGADLVWVHGDMHPLNMLVRSKRLSGVIDFGDLCAGDPATDFSVAWMLFSEETDRLAFRKLLTIDGHSVDVHSWKRAKAWALSFATAFLANSSDDPTMRRIGTITIKNVLS